MDTPKLKSRLWVQAMLRQADTQARPAAVLRRGDPDSGGILAVLRGTAGYAVLSQTRAPDGTPAWLRATGPTPIDAPTADAYVARELTRDPDLWVVEFDTPDLAAPFEAKVV